MKRWFAQNIDSKGRILRGVTALILLVGAWFALGVSIWLCMFLAVAGVFAVFEAVRGWCALRACGIKTRL